MKENTFRPVEFWKSAMMTMPDNSFFELVRSVFGKIKTPFNKQMLVSELESFLLREDILKAVSSYIDGTDAKIIAAVAALGEPAPGELESFFSGEFNYAELADIVVNLEERFILYRFKCDANSGVHPAVQNVRSRLALNPVLAGALEPFAAGISLLLPSFPLTENITGEDTASPVNAETSDGIFNDRILAGLLSFVSESEAFFRTEGEIRKKILENGKAIFPGIDLETALGGLLALGLFYVEGDRLIPDYKRFKDFAALDPRQRMEYCAAGIICYWEAQSPFGILPQLVRNRIQSIAYIIGRFLDSLETERLYPEKTLKRLAGILLHEWSVAAGKRSIYSDKPEKIDKDRMLEALEKTGLIKPLQGAFSGSPGPDTKQLKRLGVFSANPGGSAQADSPLIAADSDFSFMVYPEISCSDAIEMAQALSIRQTGLTVRFEMTKDSAIRAFDRNISAGSIIALLRRLSGDRVSEALVWSVTEWEKRYGEVSLRRGVILSLSEDRRYIAQTKALAGLIIDTIAPGIYLLHENAQNEAVDALAAAGVDIVSQKQPPAANGRPARGGYANILDRYASNFFSSPFSASQGDRALQNISAGETSGKPAAEKNTGENSPAALIQRFCAMLEKMPISKSERDELAARIQRRLILCENQLKDADIRYEKLEARLLDYTGKLNVAKQAISMQSPVELVWQDPAQGGGQGTRVFGTLKALPKKESEQCLLIVPSDGGNTISVPLGRVTLLRRIKKSIFET